MKFDSKIFVAGHSGMVGSAIERNLRMRGFKNLILQTHSQLPLDDTLSVEKFFTEKKPEYVFLAAAKVGGIVANSTKGADFINKNLRIQTNVIDAAYRYGVKKLLFLGSSCIYPKFAQQPITEDSLLTGEMEATNLPYAVAKIAGKVMCDAYQKQYGFNAFTVMPSNVYGIGDNFDPEDSHVVAGMMRRFHEAKLENLSKVSVWGTGKPKRELIYADDLADACVFLMLNYADADMVNVGSSKEVSIRDLAYIMAEVTGYKGDVIFDSTRPDGTPRKIMNNDKISRMGWSAGTEIFEGLNKMYNWWINNQ